MSRFNYDFLFQDLELLLNALSHYRELVGGIACSEHYNKMERDMKAKLYDRITSMIDEIKKEMHWRKQ